MKTREILNKVGAQVAEASARGYSLVREQADGAVASAISGGEAVRQKVIDAVEHVDVDTVLVHAKALAHKAETGANRLAGKVTDLARRADTNHKAVANGIETVSMGLGITAGVAAAGAALAAPTGISAAAVAVGLSSAPLIVAAAPVIAAAATTAGVVSGGAYFYSKWRLHTDAAPTEQDGDGPRGGADTDAAADGNPRT